MGIATAATEYPSIVVSSHLLPSFLHTGLHYLHLYFIQTLSLRLDLQFFSQFIAGFVQYKVNFPFYLPLHSVPFRIISLVSERAKTNVSGE